MASLTPIVDSAVDTTSNDPAEAPKCNFGLAGLKPRILGIGTAVPDASYTQEELLDKFRVTDPKVRSVFLNSARRYPTLPPEGIGQPESQGQLPAKHRVQAPDMGNRALNECLKEAGAEVTDIRYLVCVSSTGFLTPGFTALMIRELGLDPSCARLDVVGMGCYAGLNGLTAVAGWAAAHPGELAVLVCTEACSAAYVFDGTMRTSVVNSLFGDGAAALAVRAGEVPGGSRADLPELLDFASCIIPEAIDAMRFEWGDGAVKFSFFLEREVPYIIGAHAEGAISRLLAGNGLRCSEMAHWIVHSGGKKVVDSVRVNVVLTAHDLRHTTDVLRDFGNLSSGANNMSSVYSSGAVVDVIDLRLQLDVPYWSSADIISEISELCDRAEDSAAPRPVVLELIGPDPDAQAVTGWTKEVSVTLVNKWERVRQRQQARRTPPLGRVHRMALDHDPKHGGISGVLSYSGTFRR
ncbi:3,5-dihydroxyphenylacetyl-CoA synthase DpgA [Nonomuraea basaltis]|uniref:3,5-dihydroxyphenylacetyl-CoA synthase DpgA n=1 Tax=Nonomuraea basaltis TaxID=2495887 RepID=UPI00197EC338|nr:3,5-dihydroxyphenylacetyl-CoA synthase DpgA [Nonomuraea basaltis]